MEIQFKNGKVNNVGEKKEMGFILTSAFKQVSKGLKLNTDNDIDSTILDKQDALSNTVIKLMEKIESSEKTLNDFEFKNVNNMVIFLKGSIKKGLLNVKQEIDDYVLSFETTTTINDEIVKFENGKAFDKIMNHKDSKGNDVFTQTEKELLKAHYINDSNIAEISNELSIHPNTVTYQLKKIHEKLFRLPIRELFDTKFIYADSKGKYHFWNDTDIITNMAPLKRYRRNNDYSDLEKYHENSNQALKRHSKQGVDATIKPVPLENYKPVKNRKPKYKGQFPITLTGKYFDDKTPINRWIKASNRASSSYMIVYPIPYIEKPENTLSFEKRKNTFNKIDKVNRLINRQYVNLITQGDIRYQAYLIRLIAYKESLLID